MGYFTVKLLATGVTDFTFLAFMCVFFFFLLIILFGVTERIESLEAEVSTHLKRSLDLFNN
jgi:hypothetical protein